MRRASAAACVLVALLSCQKKPAPGASSGAPGVTGGGAPAAKGGVVGEALELLQAGRLDEALAHLDASSGDADQLALLGAVWAKKAAQAPLPTPPALSSAGPRLATPVPAPEFKPEELTALGFLERALQAQPGHGPASFSLGQLLEPHATRRLDLDKAARARRGRGKPSAPTGETDYGIERVVAAYRDAVTGQPATREAVERLYAFALRVDRLDDAQWALDQLLQGEREKPEPLVRYGDFLRDRRKEPHKAIGRYREALIWSPEDEAVQARIADIYIGEGITAFGSQQWAVAEARFKEAKKYVTNPNSPQGLKIRDYESRLASIRRPR